MENKANPRNTALNMLGKTLDKGLLSSQVTEDLFKESGLDERDRNFALNLYFGCLERLVLLDYNICAYSNVPFNKIKPVVKNILRLSLYQMFFMEKVPQRAAVSEGLKLLERRSMHSLKGYTNGVLRAAQRGGLKEDGPDYVNACTRQWIYERVCTDLGKEAADEFFKASLLKDEGLYVFLNTSLAPADEIFALLEEEGCKVISFEPPYSFKIKLSGRIEDLTAFKDGLIYVQSPNSLNVLKAALKYAGNKKDPFIMDVCASPGGKSINLSQAFPDGEILSSDKSSQKIALIDENIKRMKAENIETRVYDACIFDEALKERADIVIADAPCSGLGVISGKPDIKLRLKEEDIKALSALQRQILEVSSGYVKAGGILIYSTCTLLKEENEENAAWFKENFPFDLLESRQFLTFKGRADGFYVSVFGKN